MPPLCPSQVYSYDGMVAVDAVRQEQTPADSIPGKTIRRVFHELSRLPTERGEAPAPLQKYYQVGV